MDDRVTACPHSPIDPPPGYRSLLFLPIGGGCRLETHLSPVHRHFSTFFSYTRPIASVGAGRGLEHRSPEYGSISAPSGRTRFYRATIFWMMDIIPGFPFLGPNGGKIGDVSSISRFSRSEISLKICVYAGHIGSTSRSSPPAGTRAL